ncbi:MAG: hypothetical protein JWS12_218 [Candidatus Saccharibacteria bacterium]|nr:hypothetical protein [Candidatus Saccharibacteria bacterium]
MKLSPRQLQTFAWALSGLVALLAVLAWGQGYSWQVSNSYQLFPLLGLLAFSLMWSHYMAAALRTRFKLDKAVLHSYFEVTSYVVLVAILLHPGLLAYQLWRDGLGLPPASELHYVRQSWQWGVLLGMTALVVFLAYELHRWFDNRGWWRYVQYASDAAMVAIFIHALRLGTQLRMGWFKWIWWFYGVSLLATLIYTYAQKLQANRLKQVAKQP